MLISSISLPNMGFTAQSALPPLYRNQWQGKEVSLVLLYSIYQVDRLLVDHTGAQIENKKLNQTLFYSG